MHRPGDIIDERYQLTRPLGIRAGAEVWEAEHEVVGRKVMLKILPGDLGVDPTVQQRLVSEARAAAEIGHATVVEVYDVGVTPEGIAYLVSEPLRGETIADILGRQGALQVDDACRVTLQLCPVWKPHTPRASSTAISTQTASSYAEAPTSSSSSKFSISHGGCGREQRLSSVGTGAHRNTVARARERGRPHGHFGRARAPL